MKQISILAFFLVAFLGIKAQVNPETFPTVLPIGTDNIYSQTGGSTKKFTIQSILDKVNILDTTSITYDDFHTLITGGNLVVGMNYILTDFQTVYDQMDFDNTGALKGTLVTKTGATEQIWVLALAPDRIASQAYSATYPNDKIQYDWTYNTTFVNGSPAKGRISERIDENNNRTDYDHREIKFIRYDDGAGNFTVINDNGNASGEFLTFVQNFTGGVVKDNWLGDFYSIGALVGQEYGNNVFSGGLVFSNNSSSLVFNNTFTNNTYLNILFGQIQNNISSGQFFRNSITGFYENNKSISIITGNLFAGQLLSNTFNDVLGNNTFSSNFGNNIVNYGFSRNIISGEVISNTFNTIIESDVFNGSIENNIINSNLGSNMVFCTLGGEIQNKTIDDVTYPFLFNTNYQKGIFSASDGNVYARYFDGTNDVNTLIP